MKANIKSIGAGLLVLSGLYSSASFSATDTENYIGAQLALVTYEEDGFPDLEPTAGVLRFGSMGANGIGFEGRIGMGLSEDDVTTTVSGLNVNVEFEVDTLVGGYLVAQTQINANASVYGIIGFSNVDATATASFSGFSESASNDESGVSFGAGVNFGDSGSTRFNIEYMSYLDEDDFTVSAVSLGVLF